MIDKLGLRVLHNKPRLSGVVRSNIALGLPTWLEQGLALGWWVIETLM
jgi:hypothetical protein